MSSHPLVLIRICTVLEVILILAALAIGATTAAQDTASQAVKDVPTGLKALVKKRFEKKPQAEMALAEYKKDTDTWERPLQKSLDHVDTFGNAVEKAVTPPCVLILHGW